MGYNMMTDVYGAALSGIVFEAFIFGLLTMQVISYFKKFPGDRLWQKLLVGFVWFVECFQLIIVINMIYDYLIRILPTDPHRLEEHLWAWPTYLGLTGITAFCVQMYFARRVFMLCKHEVGRWTLAAVIAVLAVLEITFCMVVMAGTFRLAYFAEWLSLTWALDVWYGAACGADVIIAASMSFLLHTNRTGLKKTDHLLNKLIMYSIQTGLITTIGQIISMVTFSTMGWNFTHVFLSYPLGGLYCVSFLANMLARRVDSSAQGENATFVEFSDRRWRAAPPTGSSYESNNAHRDFIPVYGVQKEVEVLTV